MINLRTQPYYQYLPSKLRSLLESLYPDTSAEQEKIRERRQFIESYQPQKSFTGRFTGDIKTLLTSFYKAPSAFRQMGREAEEEARAEQARIIAQGEPKTVFGKLTSPYERYKYGAFGERAGEVDPMLQSKIFGTKISDMLVESYKKTGKWFYKPKERLQEYKEHPFLEPFEDIVNVSILLAPLLKGLGVGAKLAKTAPVKAVSKMKVPKAISAAKTALERRTKFTDITSEMQFKQYQRMKWLQEGKLKKALEAVPKSRQLELEALLTGRATPWRLTPEVGKAYKLAERSATIETKALISKGLLTAERHKFGVWKDLTKEFGKSIDDLERLGIKEPVYYPHTFTDHYAKTHLGLRKTTPAYLKTKKGVLGYEEPFISIPKHKAEYITQKTITEGLDNIAKTFGKKIGKEGLLPGYAKFKPRGYFEYFKKPGEQLIYVKKAGAYKNLQIPRQIEIACAEAFRNPLPVIMEKFFKAAWDPLTNTWKMSVLALSPRWIFNNIMGNFMLNIAGGVGPEGYIKSIRAFAKAKKAVKTKGITFERAMMREHVPTRVWESGIYRAEARAATPTATGSWLVADKAPVTSMWKKLGYKVGAVPRAMYKFNSSVESFFRTAHYLDKIGKPGFNSAKAVASVQEFLFDYSRLSTIEKATIRRLDPFWTWHKNIIRVTATYPIKYPQRVAILKKVQELTQDEQKDYRFLPEYLKSYEELPFGIGGEQAYLSMRGMNPFADVMAGISALHPALKIPIERATGVELWRERPFTSPYQQYYGAGKKVVPPLWRHIISQFPHAKLIETMFRPYAIYSTGEPILDKEGQIKYQKRRLLEVLKMFGINITTYDLDQMYEQGVSRAMREQTAKETYQEKLEKYRAR